MDEPTPKTDELTGICNRLAENHQPASPLDTAATQAALRGALQADADS